MSSLRELHQQAQKYNTQLQEYNTKLQQDVALSNDNLQKLQVKTVCACSSSCVSGPVPASLHAWELCDLWHVCPAINVCCCGLHACMRIRVSQLQAELSQTVATEFLCLTSEIHNDINAMLHLGPSLLLYVSSDVSVSYTTQSVTICDGGPFNRTTTCF